MASGYVVGEEQLMVFTIFSLLLQPFTNMNSNVVHQRKGKDIAMFLPIAAGQYMPCLLLADGLISLIFHHTQPTETFAQQVPISKTFPVTFGHFPVAHL